MNPLRKGEFMVFRFYKKPPKKGAFIIQINISAIRGTI